MVCSSFSTRLSASLTRLERLVGTTRYVELGQGPPMVVLPGLAGSVELLEPLLRALACDFRVLAVRWPGDSDERFAREDSLGSLTDHVAGFCDALRLEAPVLGGVSLGGTVALDYARRRRGRIGGLWVQGAAGRHEMRLFEQTATQVLDRWSLPADNPHLNRLFGLLLDGGHRDGATLEFVASHCWRTDQTVALRRLELLRDHDVTDGLAEVECPAVLFAAAEDILVYRCQMHELAGSLRQSHLVDIQDAGHFAFATHGQAMAEHCREAFTRRAARVAC